MSISDEVFAPVVHEFSHIHAISDKTGPHDPVENHIAMVVDYITIYKKANSNAKGLVFQLFICCFLIAHCWRIMHGRIVVSPLSWYFRRGGPSKGIQIQKETCCEALRRL